MKEGAKGSQRAHSEASHLEKVDQMLNSNWDFVKLLDCSDSSLEGNRTF